MGKIKYVVLQGESSPNSMILFPAWIEHCVMTKLEQKIISAGFVDIETKTCYGQSISLKLYAQEEDNILLKLLLRSVI